MSLGKILITKPFGYKTLDDASELEFKVYDSYSDLLGKNFEVTFADLKDVEKHLIGTDDYGVIIAEVPNGVKDQKIKVLAKYVNDVGKHFCKKQIILITNEDGMYNSDLIESFLNHGSFGCLKPLYNHNLFLDTVKNCYSTYLDQQYMKYFRISPISKQFEKYFVSEEADDEQEAFSALNKKSSHLFSGFLLEIKNQLLFTSAERYFNIYSKEEDFNELNIRLLKHKLVFEKKYKQKINISLLIR